MIDSVFGSWGWVALFGVHLVVFAALAVRKRTWQYLPAILTFAVLVTLNGLRAVEVGDDGLYLTLRVLAFVGLGVSVLSWWRRRAAQSSASS